jgi:hypothetical protein
VRREGKLQSRCKFWSSNVAETTGQRSVGVRHHKGNSLDPKKDDFLKLMMQSSHFFQERRKTEPFVNYLQGGDKEDQIFEHFSKLF